MKVYVIEKEEQRQRERVYQNLREGITQLYPKGMVRVIEPLSRVSAQSFLLETAQGLIWNRLFYEKSRAEELDIIGRQIEQLQETLNLPVTAQLMIPAALMEAWLATEEPAKSLRKLRGDGVQIFEYRILQSGAREGLTLKEWTGPHEGSRLETSCAEEKTAVPALKNGRVLAPQIPAGVISAGRLTRDELNELLELGLEVQSHRPAVR